MNANPKGAAPDDAGTAAEARAALERLRHEPTFAQSALAAHGRRVADHMAGMNPGESRATVDPIELWGRRIGRAASLFACITLAIYLAITYLL